MPTAQSPLIKYGISMLHYAPITAISDAGVPTYATPVPFPGAISTSLSAQGERRQLSADNVVYFESWSNGGYEGDVNVAMIPQHFRIACLNEKEDAAEGSPTVYETSELITQHFALLFQFETDVGPVRVVLYNCTASRPQIASQTVDGESGVDASQSTETFSLSAKPRRDNKLIRCKTKVEAQNTEVFNNWFQSVYVPTLAAA